MVLWMLQKAWNGTSPLAPISHEVHPLLWWFTCACLKICMVSLSVFPEVCEHSLWRSCLGFVWQWWLCFHCSTWCQLYSHTLSHFYSPSFLSLWLNKYLKCPLLHLKIDKNKLLLPLPAHYGNIDLGRQSWWWNPSKEICHTSVHVWCLEER